jgi:hypothetical protein
VTATIFPLPGAPADKEWLSPFSRFDEAVALHPTMSEELVLMR